MTPETVRLDGPGSSVVVATGFGPRVVGLLVDGRNLFAELPDDVLEAGGQRYRLRGGHRLWAAPEVPAVTYRSDDEPCAVTPNGGGLRVEGPADGAGLAKTLELAPTDDGWAVRHTIENRGAAPVAVAPWAITQLRPGGRATLALGEPGTGLQADRAVVFWPYTDPEDARLQLSAGAVHVDGGAGPPLKVGVAGGPGAGAYDLEGVRFSKRITPAPDEPHADLGAAVQVYVHPRFVELETLGPLRTVAPGEAAAHREEWILA